MSNAAAVVSLRDVTKSFGAGGVTAVQAIDLDVHTGEFVSLIGPSGCGKSTLLRIVGDLVEPTSGEVVVNAKSARQARLDRDYGIVFQDPVLYDWRTVARNIAMPLELLGWDRAKRAARVQELLELVELHEPFGALDEMTRERLNGELLRIWEASASTIVFVTHSISEAVFLSSRVVVMSRRPGRISAIVDVDLPQPRNPDTREDPRFFELVTVVRDRLREGGLDEGSTAPGEGEILVEETS
jgi:NitT/TauT family transport system ATP-binding protein